MIAAQAALRAGVLRYFNVAGADPAGRADQSTPEATHLIKIACEAACGLRDEVIMFGTDWTTPDGTGVRDYIHVSGLVAAHLLMLNHLRARAARRSRSIAATGAAIRCARCWTPWRGSPARRFRSRDTVSPWRLASISAAASVRNPDNSPGPAPAHSRACRHGSCCSARAASSGKR
ncbi:NAD-dependent epimerase/dehydratase family protein [Rhodobacteraceae bacterium MCCB 386]|nr:NAD-dependent epimerase/dehydratase family protein [Roseitranquillus sediminis]MBM9593889.1 NAD-dependent epimerase/dehydratase family protein [Roseitranquillus sediminis]